MRLRKRMTGIYFLISLLFLLVIYRVYYVNTTGTAFTSSTTRGTYTVDIAKTRGMIYDTNMNGLVNQEYHYLASVTPTVQAATALLTAAEGEAERDALLGKLTDGTPFVMNVTGSNIYAEGVDIFRIPSRYGNLTGGTRQLAPHIIGYLSGDGSHGVAGVEKAFDEFLSGTGSSIRARYETDAAGQLMRGAGAGIEINGDNTPLGGVVLTIDSGIQRIVESALRGGCEKGAAVVMDVFTGDVLAMESIPVFDQNDISASFESEDAPFINRAISGYNIGSAFKIIVSAAALEYGIPSSYRHVCPGYAEIDGRIFRCNNNVVHGDIDMERALQVSCNAYFITLARELSPSYLASMARNLGLGNPCELAPGMSAQTGNIPDSDELSNPLAYANFSFGQGSSLSTPLQMAQAVAVVANSGMSVTPRIIKGFTLDGVELAEQTPIYSQNQIISERTARILRELMASVVEKGSGRTAKPLNGGAGGKTSSAQTGILKDGEEIVHAWFVGFYPAEKPKYSIIVFVEGGESGEKVAAPIFRHIADGIAGINAHNASET